MRKYRELEELTKKYPDISPVLLFKISMTKYGAEFTDKALLRLQEADYRFTKAEPFGIPLEIRKEDFFIPGPVCFRDGSTVLVNFGEPYEDPYIIDYDEEAEIFPVLDEDVVVDVIDFIPRPAFFDGTTSLGTPMDRVGGTCSGQRLLLNALQRCRFWEEGNQCHYCALFGAGSVIGEVNTQDIRETLLAAIAEPGRFSEISLSGGSDFGGDPPFSEELERYIKVLKVIGEPFGQKADIQLMVPAYPKDWLKRLYEETPLTSYRPNIEIWNEEIFKRMCPGKEKWIGRKEWVRRMCDAVDVFGKGRVYTQMVCGAELADEQAALSEEEAVRQALEGCTFFAENGISCHEEMWRPNRMEKLGWRERCSMEYYTEIAKGFHEIRKARGICDVDNNFMRGGDNPDADLERGDYCDVLPDLHIGGFDRKRQDYTALKIPEEIRNRLEGAVAVYICAGEDEPSNRMAYQVSAPAVWKNRSLLLPLQSDRSELSSFLIRHLWAEKPVRLLIPDGNEKGTDCSAVLTGEVLTCRVFRNHIVGPAFSAAGREGTKNGMTDISQAAELQILKREGTQTIPLVIRNANDRFFQPHLIKR